NRDHPSHLRSLEWGRHQLDRPAERRRVEQERRDVLEDDAPLGKIGHVADAASDRLHVSAWDQGTSHQSIDLKGLRDADLMWNVELFHTQHSRCRWPSPEGALELRERGVFALSHDLDRAVGQVAAKPAEAEALRLPQHEPPETHSLHPAVHEVAVSGHGALPLAVLLSRPPTVPPSVDARQDRQSREDDDQGAGGVAARLLVQHLEQSVLATPNEPSKPDRDGA